jgi:hypothetical protein
VACGERKHPINCPLRLLTTDHPFRYLNFKLCLPSSLFVSSRTRFVSKQKLFRVILDTITCLSSHWHDTRLYSGKSNVPFFSYRKARAAEVHAFYSSGANCGSTTFWNAFWLIKNLLASQHDRLWDGQCVGAEWHGGGSLSIGRDEECLQHSSRVSYINVTPIYQESAPFLDWMKVCRSCRLYDICKACHRIV